MISSAFSANLLSSFSVMRFRDPFGLPIGLALGAPFRNGRPRGFLLGRLSIIMELRLSQPKTVQRRNSDYRSARIRVKVLSLSGVDPRLPNSGGLVTTFQNAQIGGRASSLEHSSRSGCGAQNRRPHAPD